MKSRTRASKYSSNGVYLTPSVSRPGSAALKRRVVILVLFYDQVLFSLNRFSRLTKRGSGAWTEHCFVAKGTYQLPIGEGGMILMITDPRDTQFAPKLYF